MLTFDRLVYQELVAAGDTWMPQGTFEHEQHHWMQQHGTSVGAALTILRGDLFAHARDISRELERDTGAWSDASQAILQFDASARRLAEPPACSEQIAHHRRLALASRLASLLLDDTPSALELQCSAEVLQTSLDHAGLLLHRTQVQLGTGRPSDVPTRILIDCQLLPPDLEVSPKAIRETAAVCAELLSARGHSFSRRADPTASSSLLAELESLAVRLQSGAPRKVLTYFWKATAGVFGPPRTANGEPDGFGFEAGIFTLLVLADISLSPPIGPTYQPERTARDHLSWSDVSPTWRFSRLVGAAAHAGVLLPAPWRFNAKSIQGYRDLVIRRAGLPDGEYAPVAYPALDELHSTLAAPFVQSNLDALLEILEQEPLTPLALALWIHARWIEFRVAHPHVIGLPTFTMEGWLGSIASDVDPAANWYLPQVISDGETLHLRGGEMYGVNAFMLTAGGQLWAHGHRWLLGQRPASSRFQLEPVEEMFSRMFVSPPGLSNLS